MKLSTSQSLYQDVKKNKLLYVMVLPGLIWLLMFRLIPNLGIVIAFQDYNIFRGITESEWVGLKHFIHLFQNQDFYRIFFNTMAIAFLALLFEFPAPIILALSLNEIRSSFLKRGLQTIFYLPHFFSWVMISALFFQLLSMNGVVNQIIVALGGQRILLVQQTWFFRPMIVITGLYRDIGYGTIVYLAAIASIDTQMYEAALIDGANKFQQIRYITLPSLIPTAIVLLLLSIGRFMQLGFDRIYNFLTPLTFSVGDIFDTYVYRVGITEGQFSLTTAVGLFQSLITFVMIWFTNRLMKKQTGGGLW